MSDTMIHALINGIAVVALILILEQLSSFKAASAFKRHLIILPAVFLLIVLLEFIVLP